VAIHPPVDRFAALAMTKFANRFDPPRRAPRNPRHGDRQMEIPAMHVVMFLKALIVLSMAAAVLWWRTDPPAAATDAPPPRAAA